MRLGAIESLCESVADFVPRFDSGSEYVQDRVHGSHHLCVALDSGGRGKSRVSIVEDEDHLVVVHGSFALGDNRNLAQEAFRFAKDGCWKRLRDEQGSFAALHFSKHKGEVHVLNDFLGRKTMRFSHQAGLLGVASHDLLLPLTGIGDSGVDLLGAVSVLSMDFSSRGRSLIKGVSTLTAREHLEWSGGIATVCDWPNPVSKSRETTKAESRSDLLRRMQAHFVKELNAVIDKFESVKCDLTGGQDSRALFGALVKSPSREKLRFEFRGGDGSNDCRVARRLAERYGMRFKNAPFSTQDTGSIEKNGELLAFYGNAQVNCKRAFDGLLAGGTENELHLSAIGAEFYRGYYYKELLHLPREQGVDWAYGAIAKYYVPRSIPGLDPNLLEQFRSRFMNDLGEIARKLSPNGYDVTDLWYLYERFSCWGGAYMGLPWMGPFWSPFADHELVRLGMAQSPPMGRRRSFVDELVLRNIPRAYWMRTNNGFIMGLPARYVFKWLGSRFGEMKKRLVRTKESEEEQSNPDGYRIEQIGGAANSLLEEILTQSGGLVSELLGDGAVRDVLKSCRSGANRQNLVGNMLTLHFYELLLKRASAIGQKMRLR